MNYFESTDKKLLIVFKSVLAYSTNSTGQFEVTLRNGNAALYPSDAERFITEFKSYLNALKEL